ncbi:RNA polymerase sigma-70 factor (ECF subfamily) [Streptosporangium becharense]|uniref:RNA polymerase sigma factor n=1 Tax=Streptosporangium becharense TaxID=1816182 RepID=A0A7W9IKK3_9ACTN|nr:sigma-70 family RNA polymerase sigma factor [Streptosporangium becharense]MBB2911785.1 RNA polymerase sigma-70 factor (ECF subfamily) [Streptosporangium becharense]MBB5822397.1 RNA polymerase sigma-70 factor (ECF subfamily) [Streptosporangium becharense]
MNRRAKATTSGHHGGGSIWRTGTRARKRDDGKAPAPDTRARPGGVPEREGPASGARTDDARVIARIAWGDPQALTELYERYARPLFAFLYRLAGDRGTAEEILQDTLLAVWRSAHTYQGRSTVGTWLFGVARRQAHNRLRATPPPLAADPFDRPDPAPGPEELATGDDRVQKALARLPLAQREVVVLAFLDDLGHREIAEVLGIPVGTVKSRLHHARATLRECIDERLA